MEIAAFLRLFPPFSDLPDDRLSRIARSVEIVHLPEGTVIETNVGPPPGDLHVIRKGVVEVLRDGEPLDELGEGELFGPSMLLVDERPAVSFRTREDTLCYLLTGPTAGETLEVRRSLLSAGMRRLREGTGRVPPDPADPADPRARRVRELVRRAAVTADPGVTIAEAAALMAHERVSSLLIPMRGSWAILTDRDLRSRVVAAGVDIEGTAGSVATFPVRTVDAGALTTDALTEMFAASVHHLPVLEGGRLVGVVTDTDLMGIGRHTPFALKSAIARARTPAELADAGRDLPELVAALVDAGADPLDVARTSALAVDAMTVRLVVMAVRELGDPPVPFAWLALGSTARHEHALTDTQHHALVYDGTHLGADRYFSDLAERVTGGLDGAGIARSHGETMAVHPAMRGPLQRWIERAKGSIDGPGDIDATILSPVGLDARRQTGGLDADAALADALRGAAGDRSFLARMARGALDQAPPSGFVDGLVVERPGTHAQRLDAGQVIAIATDLARVWGLAAGTPARDTVGRLHTAAAALILDPEIAEELSDAFRFMWEVRLRHHAEQIRAGLPPDDAIDPVVLGAVTRSQVKEAFRVLRRAQRRLADDLGGAPR